MSRTSPVSETPDILERLQEESMRLCGRSISRGDLDSGLASNLADAAIYEIERLRGLVDQLNFVVSSGLAQTPADATMLMQARYVLKNLHVERPGCGYDKLAAACEAAALSDTSTDRPVSFCSRCCGRDLRCYICKDFQ